MCSEAVIPHCADDSVLTGGDQPGLQVLCPRRVCSAALAGGVCAQMEEGQQRRQAGLPFELLLLPLPRELFAVLPVTAHMGVDT